MKTYRIVTEVYEVTDDGNELLTRVGGTAEAPSFPEALPLIGQTINDQYTKVQELAETIEGT